jgi:hypothetical protein
MQDSVNEFLTLIMNEKNQTPAPDILRVCRLIDVDILSLLLLWL